MNSKFQSMRFERRYGNQLHCRLSKSSVFSVVVVYLSPGDRPIGYLLASSPITQRDLLPRKREEGEILSGRLSLQIVHPQTYISCHHAYRFCICSVHFYQIVFIEFVFKHNFNIFFFVIRFVVTLKIQNINDKSLHFLLKNVFNNRLMSDCVFDFSAVYLKNRIILL